MKAVEAKIEICVPYLMDGDSVRKFKLFGAGFCGVVESIKYDERPSIKHQRAAIMTMVQRWDIKRLNIHFVACGEFRQAGPVEKVEICEAMVSELNELGVYVNVVTGTTIIPECDR